MHFEKHKNKMFFARGHYKSWWFSL